MPHKNTSLIEELLTLGEHAVTQLMKSRGTWRKHAHAALQDMALKCDLVTRDEFDAAMAMLSKARAIHEKLKKRVAALESTLNQSGITMNRGKSSKASLKMMKTVKPSLRSVKQGNRRKRR